MYRHGHTGIALFAYAPIAYVLLTTDHPALALFCGIGVLAVEPLPDWDFRLPALSHRGVSHSMVTVLVIGSVLAAGGWYVGRHALEPAVRLVQGTAIIKRTQSEPLLAELRGYNANTLAVTGFFIGAYGIFVHLLGDVITIAGIRPLLPFSRWRVSVSQLHAKSRAANTAFLLLGVLAIVLVLYVAVPGAGAAVGTSFNDVTNATNGSLSPVGVVAAQPMQTTTQPTNQTSAAVELDSTNNTTATAVVVSEVRLPDGGFVAIHDEGFSEGGILRGSELTVSRYLGPGTHRNVTIPVERGVPGASANVSRLNLTVANLSAIAYRDTNHDHHFEFITSRERNDTPYQRPDGGIAADTESITIEPNVARANQRSRIEPATIRFTNQSVRRANGSQTVVAETVTLPRGGFVAVHDARYLPPIHDPLDSTIGLSRYLTPGTHRNVTIQLLNGSINGTQTLVAVPYLDTDSDQHYDYVETGGETDYAYLARQNGTTVVVNETASVRAPTSTHVITTETGLPTPTKMRPTRARPERSTTPIVGTETPPTTGLAGGVGGESSRDVFSEMPVVLLLSGAFAFTVVLMLVASLAGQLRDRR